MISGQRVFNRTEADDAGALQGTLDELYNYIGLRGGACIFVLKLYTRERVDKT